MNPLKVYNNIQIQIFFNNSNMNFSLLSFNTHHNGLAFNSKFYYDLKFYRDLFLSDINIFQEIILNEFPNQFAERIGYNYLYHEIGTFNVKDLNDDKRKDKLFCLVLETKFEILRHEIIYVGHYGKDPRNTILKATLKINNEEVIIYAIHLTVGSLPYGSFKQLQLLVKDIDLNKKIIFVGDHNLWSFAVRLLLPKSFTQVVRGGTWPSVLPFNQIDQIFSNNLEVIHGKVINKKVSDHLPITANFSI